MKFNVLCCLFIALLLSLALLWWNFFFLLRLHIVAKPCMAAAIHEHPRLEWWAPQLLFHPLRNVCNASFFTSSLDSFLLFHWRRRQNTGRELTTQAQESTFLSFILIWIKHQQNVQLKPKLTSPNLPNQL